MRIENDPYRTANIALIVYMNGYMSYILAAEDISKEIFNGSEKRSSAMGSSFPLYLIPNGTLIFNIELTL